MRLGNTPDESWAAFCGRCRRTIAEDESKVVVEAAWATHLEQFHAMPELVS